ncbi:hypothetical protein NBRC10512_007329 [Rhodotorula toruloides]|uniref:Uncharacterized protein n=1 Tax=Rhodotorula toruloides (strain NP11) TaxID=1130832 RepID=M7X2M9_RHOT1|nr:uncharacterized protein RHTO_04765 [Rhodotorula toruloides NP11]EMS24586.1 hypothetical protein RHTO_04765 [Rhodotorula toruloides NP11]
MTTTSDTPITSTAKASEAPAAAHTGDEAAAASPSSSNEQAKEDKEDKEGEKSDNDQEEQKCPSTDQLSARSLADRSSVGYAAAGIWPLVGEEGGGPFQVFATSAGVPLCSPYPSEQQIRRRYEEEAESAEKTAKAAAASESEEEEQDEEENGSFDASFPSAPASRGPSKISLLTGTSDLSPAASSCPPEEQRRRRAEDKAETENE